MIRDVEFIKESYITVHDPDKDESLNLLIKNSVPSDLGFSIEEHLAESERVYQFSLWISQSINFEEFEDIDLTLTVADGSGMSLDCVLHVYIDDCNDPPSIAMQTIDVKEDSVYGDIVGTVLAYDDDPGDSLYFSIIDQKKACYRPIAISSQAIVRMGRLPS